MSISDNDTSPTLVPIFPLAGALLLPGGKLPLNIFEPRYLAMIKDAMASDRLIGMVQPRDTSMDPPSLYEIGCLGRITSFTETEDNRFLITLTGTSRFRITEEISSTTPYRKVRPDLSGFIHDKSEDQSADVDRDILLSSLKRYLDKRGLGADWDAIDGAPTDILVNSLAMICPFSVPEKQALLEAIDLAARARTMMTLMEFAMAEGDNDNDSDTLPDLN